MSSANGLHWCNRCDCYILINIHYTILFIFVIRISGGCRAQSQLMQQTPESSSWHSRAWHHPPLSSAFVCSVHNLRKAADCRQRAALCLSWSRQLLAGRTSAFNAHSSCHLPPDAAYGWHHPHTAVHSLWGWAVILNKLFFKTFL